MTIPLLSLWEKKNKSQIFNSRQGEYLSVYFRSKMAEIKIFGTQSYAVSILDYSLAKVIKEGYTAKPGFVCPTEKFEAWVWQILRLQQ
ncbi:hypothetical protein AB0759_09810 [Scytonema tolypothrichoides VB-61278_2]|uniref:Uncharacterized protein n=3 Tax=Nostocales TaxID=1161 RepID=A0A8S9T6M1_9CYAN|nr:hypothetical protein [Tolypothrix bouteillei]KAF3888100.1 hypothetical protein DA73_0400023355 [Tolypothrix bouteillei VB521301]